MAQCNLSFEKIFAPSRDPSPTLPFWDKMRLLYHGRLTIIAKQYTVLLHASLDPYNSTEEMELTWNNCGIIWTNAKIIFKGELNVIIAFVSQLIPIHYFPLLGLRSDGFTVRRLSLVALSQLEIDIEIKLALFGKSQRSSRRHSLCAR